jgi:hypothetical protein
MRDTNILSVFVAIVLLALSLVIPPRGFSKTQRFVVFLVVMGFLFLVIIFYR